MERLARIYRAGVLEFGEAHELLEYCELHGGALDQAAIEDLLEPELGYRPSPPPPAPAPPEPTGARRALNRIGDAIVLLLVGLFSLLWYGMWAALAVSLVGGFLFGWFDDEAGPPPARVTKVRVDRTRCEVDAVVLARRPMRHLRLRVAGFDSSGKDLGQLTRDVGKVPPGRSTVPVARLSRGLCHRTRPFTTRVRAVFDARLGRMVEVRSPPKARLNKR